MIQDTIAFEQWCENSWGAPTRSGDQFFVPNTPQIRDVWCFNNLSPTLKVRVAETLILESCSHVGSFAESGAVSWFLHSFGTEFQGTSPGFQGRRHQPLKAAILLTSLSQFSSMLPSDRSDSDHILAGGAAMSAMYLLASIEHLCRVKGRYLGSDGQVNRPIPQQLRKKAGVRSNQSRVNRVHQALILYLYRNRSPLGKRLQGLEKKLGVAKRLAMIRDPVMHGELADPSVEATFLGLLTAMFYYGAADTKT